MNATEMASWSPLARRDQSNQQLVILPIDVVIAAAAREFRRHEEHGTPC